MSGSPSRSGSTDHRAVRDDLGHLGALLAQLLGEQLAADVGVRQQDFPAADVAAVGDRAQHGFRAVLGRRQVDLQAVARQPLGGRRADDAQLDAAERAQILRSGQQPLDERVDGVRAREDDPVEVAARAHASSSGP